MRYADCAATSSNESIETFSRRYVRRVSVITRYLPVRRRALDIPIKLRLIARYAPIKYFSVCVERSLGVVPRNLEPRPRILRILALVVYAYTRAGLRGICASVLRAEEQLDAVPPFLQLEESPFLRRIIPIGTQRFR